MDGWYIYGRSNCCNIILTLTIITNTKSHSLLFNEIHDLIHHVYICAISSPMGWQILVCGGQWGCNSKNALFWELCFMDEVNRDIKWLGMGCGVLVWWGCDVLVWWVVWCNVMCWCDGWCDVVWCGCNVLVWWVVWYASVMGGVT